MIVFLVGHHLWTKEALFKGRGSSGRIHVHILPLGLKLGTSFSRLSRGDAWRKK